MTHIEEEKVTTTREEVDPPKPKVENINLNVNTRGGETVTVDQTPDETGQTRTETTETEVRTTE